MGGVEELVLEYVSGFNDLSPLQSLKRLRSLHLENLRRVQSFGGLSGIDSLRYLAIYGTLDWKQPIEGFEFLRGLPSLEVLAFWEVINKQSFPAVLPFLNLKNLKRLRLHGSYLAAEEYALLEEGLKGVEGATWGPYRTEAFQRIELSVTDIRAHLSKEALALSHPEVIVEYDGKRTIADPSSRWIESTGKRGGRIRCGSANAEAKAREYEKRYDEMKKAARRLIAEQHAV